MAEGQEGRRRGPSADRAAIRAAAVFAFIGFAWILGSDRLLDVFTDERVEGWLQTVKGSLFIASVAVVIYVLVRRLGRQWQAAERDARAAAEALRRSESRYRSLVERVPGVVWLNEVDRGDPAASHCIYIGPQIEHLLGYSPEAWMADDDLWLRIVHPDDRPSVVATNDGAETRGSLSMEYRAIRSDGQVRWIHDEAVLIPGPDDASRYWQGVMVDITEQREKDDELQELSASLRGVFDASPLAILVLETDARVRHWNPAAERIFGWSADEVVGRPAPYIPDDRREEFEWSIAETFAGRSVAGLETVRLRKDGDRVPVRLSTAPLVGPDGSVTGALGVVEDVTERKRVADELEARRRQQEAVAGLALLALEGGAPQAVLDAAAELVADTLRIDLSGVLELLPDERTLLLRSAVGWGEGVVGSMSLGRDDRSLASYALESAEPVIVDDLGSEDRFPRPPHLVDRGVVSAVATVVYGGRRPYGVLEALATTSHVFTRDHVRFLQGIAAIIGLAIERDRAQVGLQAAEERYRNLVEESPAIVYLLDIERSPGRLTYMSPQIVELLGFPREAWTADPAFRQGVVHEADRDRFVRACREAIEGQAPLDVEYRVTSEDGREVWVQDRATLLRGPDDTPRFYQGVLVDITARRHAEEERRVALDRQLRLATRLELLHLIDREILSSASIEEMSTRTLDHLRLLVPYDRGSVVVVDPATDRFAYAATRSPSEFRLDVDLASLPPDEFLRDLLARDVVVPDLDELPSDNVHLAGLRELGLRSGLSIALGSGDRQEGALILLSRTLNAFDEESVDIAREVGSELAIAIAQMRLRHSLASRAAELEQVAEERQQMLHRIVRAQEEERERVALELHDGLGQILTSISLFASDLAEEVRDEAKPRAQRVNELVLRAISDSRQLVWSLRPPELERLGLVPALRRLADATSAPALTVDLHEQIGDVRLPPESEAVVYRVVQEAVHNAQKHARATAISILLQPHDGHLTTLVEDNGRGFDPGSIPPGRGLGLIGMRERAELVRGSLVVESAVHAGTRVRLMVPVGAAPTGSSGGSAA
jgi:PAS domain S-box-containing protein